MEIVDENVAMVSNFEVFDVLTKSEEKSKGKRPNGRSQDLATIRYETTEYLIKTPCVQQVGEEGLTNRCKELAYETSSNPKVIQKFLERLSKYELTKAEKLQLLNLRPTSHVEIQLMIEEVEERFSEDEIQELLELVTMVLPDSSGQEAMETESLRTTNKEDGIGT